MIVAATIVDGFFEVVLLFFLSPIRQKTLDSLIRGQAFPV